MRNRACIHNPMIGCDPQDREREYIEIRADMDGKRWLALYPPDWIGVPHDGAVRMNFTTAYAAGGLGEARNDADTFAIYRAAFLRGVLSAILDRTASEAQGSAPDDGD